MEEKQRIRREKKRIVKKFMDLIGTEVVYERGIKGRSTRLRFIGCSVMRMS